MRDRAMRAKRRAEALRLTLEGFSLVEIGEKLDLSPKTVFVYIDTEIKAITAPYAADAAAKREHERNRSLARCEEVNRAFWDKMKAGNEKAAEVINKNEIRRAKLLGLDAPTKVDTTVSLAQLKDMSDEALAAIAAGGAAAKETAAPAEDADAGDLDDGDDSE